MGESTTQLTDTTTLIEADLFHSLKNVGIDYGLEDFWAFITGGGEFTESAQDVAKRIGNEEKFQIFRQELNSLLRKQLTPFTETQYLSAAWLINATFVEAQKKQAYLCTVRLDDSRVHDGVQDRFFKIFKNKKVEEFDGYFNKSLRRYCIDLARKNQTFSSFVDKYTPYRRITLGEQLDPSCIASIEEERELLYRSLENLTPKHLQVINYVLNYTGDGAVDKAGAAELCISVGTFGSRLSYAKERLRALMAANTQQRA